MNASNSEKLKLAQKRISKEYSKSGGSIVEYYTHFIPDLWQQAHDDLEEVIREGDERLISNHLTIFEGTLFQLIDGYRRATKVKK